MKIEEARNSIGKKVDYTNKDGVKVYSSVILRSVDYSSRHGIAKVSFDPDDNSVIAVGVEDIELSEQENKQPNYKIRVTEETSAEVQKLFFQLGDGWGEVGKKTIGFDYHLDELFLVNGYIYDINDDGADVLEITIPELRKLVLDSKNEYGFEKEIESHNIPTMPWVTNKVPRESLTELQRYENAHNTAQMMALKVGFDFSKNNKPCTGRKTTLERSNGRTVTQNEDGSVFISKMNSDEYNKLVNLIISLPEPSINLEAREYTEAELLLIIEELRK